MTRGAVFVCPLLLVTQFELAYKVHKARSANFYCITFDVRMRACAWAGGWLEWGGEVTTAGCIGEPSVEPCGGRLRAVLPVHVGAWHDCASRGEVAMLRMASPRRLAAGGADLQRRVHQLAVVRPNLQRHVPVVRRAVGCVTRVVRTAAQGRPRPCRTACGAAV